MFVSCVVGNSFPVSLAPPRGPVVISILNAANPHKTEAGFGRGSDHWIDWSLSQVLLPT